MNIRILAFVAALICQGSAMADDDNDFEARVRQAGEDPASHSGSYKIKTDQVKTDEPLLSLTNSGQTNYPINYYVQACEAWTKCPSGERISCRSSGRGCKTFLTRGVSVTCQGSNNAVFYATQDEASCN